MRPGRWRAAIALSVLVGCGDSAVNGVVVAGPPVASVVVTPFTTNVLEGQTAQLNATAFDTNGEEITVAQFVWESSDTEIATVSSTGLVTGESAGAATVTATGMSGGTEASADALVTVEASVSPTGRN